MFVQLVDVFKIRIGILMAVTALAGFAVTPGRDLSVWEILLLALAVLGASASAGAFNQYVERDLDACMSRTRNRPFVTGHFIRGYQWLWIISLLLLISVGLAGFLFNTAVALHVFLGAFFYAVVYTLWLKPRTAWNIVIGGAAGSFAVLAGAAAADPSLNPASLLLALVLFLWTPPHFWSLAIVLHKDYAQARVPMLPVTRGDAYTAKAILISTLLLVGVSLTPVFFGSTVFGLGGYYVGGALIGGAYFIFKSIKLLQNPNPKTAMRCFLASLLQLTLLLIAAMLDTWLVV